MKPIRHLLAVATVAAGWVAVFLLNEIVFDAFRLSALANWIFVPAAVRLIAVLLFGRMGGVGLAVGAFIVLQIVSDTPWPYDLALASTSGIAPLAALALCRTFLTIPTNLAGMRARDIIILSITSAGCNALLLTIFHSIANTEIAIPHYFRIIFIGDMVGSALMMFLLSMLLTLALPRRSDAGQGGGIQQWLKAGRALINRKRPHGGATGLRAPRRRTASG